MATTQTSLVMEYFIKNPNRDIHHEEIVPWLVSEFKERTGKTFRDPDRAIRKLHQAGFLIKVAKGVYRYDPDLVISRHLEDFTPEIRQQIFERDEYRCVVCRRGPKEGLEIQADHIKPKDLGGRATLENGQTLCSEHNFRKKNYSQTESGKRIFMRLYDAAKQENDQQTMAFCAAVLKVFDDFGVNGHIEWTK